MGDETAKEAAPAPEKVLLIPAPQAQAILNYLARQPFGEVYNLVPMLMNLKEAPIVVGPCPALAGLPDGPEGVPGAATED
jgi:hypothetical protein